MKNIPLIVVLLVVLAGCESLYEQNGGIDTIRSQRQVDAYNATVSSEGEKLVCSKEKPLGSNISRFTCVTKNQQDRLAAQARQDIQAITGFDN